MRIIMIRISFGKRWTATKRTGRYAVSLSSDRLWLDEFRFPISEKAVLEERWDRPSPNRLRVRLKLTDPVTYTAPWESSTKVWALIPKKAMAIGGWSGLLEDRCVPSDESLFNQFRDRAAGVGEVGPQPKE